MKAVWFDQFGPAGEVLTVGEKPTPTPAAGEVLVRLKTSGPNPSDVKKRAASFPNLLDNGYVIPHSDGAGIIEAVGDGVSQERVGERVWVYQAQYGRRFGTAAEYVAVESQRAPKLPDAASFEIGACLGIPVMTAHRTVFAGGDVKGQTVLITGGAGRVGYYAIQWAAMAGATVIATASNDADAATCREVGAQHVVNHRDEDWPADLLTFTKGEKVDRIVDVDFATNIEKSLEIIRTSGTIATYSSGTNLNPVIPFYRMMFMDLTVYMAIVYAMPEEAKQAAIKDIDTALTAGTLKHRIAETLPLDDCAKAHKLIEDGKAKGCVVLQVGDA
ncbi:NADPH:quinone reductase [Henriciella sp. AS95]|uniref:NADPH:quinone reductase n=1 Tax=Henriciella sp. AS95 TaxID=3135782 RepID=UPI00317B3862